MASRRLETTCWTDETLLHSFAADTPAGQVHHGSTFYLFLFLFFFFYFTENCEFNLQLGKILKLSTTITIKHQIVNDLKKSHERAELRQNVKKKKKGKTVSDSKNKIKSDSDSYFKIN